MKLDQVKNGMKVYTIRTTIWNLELYKNNEYAVYGCMFRGEFIPAKAEYADKDISVLLANVLSGEEINLSEVQIGYVFDNKFTELEQKICKPV